MSSKRTILITGGSRGIGYACCKRLGDEGMQTISLARQPPEQPLASNTHYCVDLADPLATAELLTGVLKEHDISGVVCNAGQGHIGSLENFSASQIQQSLQLNLISPLCLARQCLPILKQHDRSDLIFLGSTSALEGARYGSLYSASKFGLRGAAQSLRHELSGANCHVGIVQPGMVRTQFFDSLGFEPGPEEAHALHPADVAEAVVTLINSPDRAVISEWVVQPRQHVVQKRKR